MAVEKRFFLSGHSVVNVDCNDNHNKSSYRDCPRGTVPGQVSAPAPVIRPRPRSETNGDCHSEQTPPVRHGPSLGDITWIRGYKSDVNIG